MKEGTHLFLDKEHQAKAGKAGGYAQAGKATRGSKWYTNGVESVRVLPAQEAPSGFVLGRTKTKKLGNNQFTISKE